MKKCFFTLISSMFLVACEGSSNSINTGGSENTAIERRDDHPPVSKNLRLISNSPTPISNEIINIDYDFYDIDGDEESTENKYISYYVNGNKIGEGDDFKIPSFSSKTRMTAELIVVSKTGSEKYSSFTSKISFDVLPSGTSPTVNNLVISSFDNSIQENTVLFVNYDFFDNDGDEESGTVMEWIDLDSGNVLEIGNSLKLDSITKDLNISFQITPKTNLDNSHGYNVGNVVSKNISDYIIPNSFLYQYEIPSSNEDATHSQYIIKSGNGFIKNYFSLAIGYENSLDSTFQTHMGIYNSFQDENYTFNKGYLESPTSIKVLLPPRSYKDYDDLYLDVKNKEDVINLVNAERLSDSNIPLDFDVPLISPNGSAIKNKYFTNRSMNVSLHSNAVLYEDQSLFVFNDVNNEAAFFTNNGSPISNNIETLGIPFNELPTLSNYSYDNAKEERELPSMTPNGGDSLYIPNIDPPTSEIIDKYENSNYSFSSSVIDNVEKKELKGMREHEQFANSIDIVKTATTLAVGGTSDLNIWLNYVKNLSGDYNNIKSIIAYQDHTNHGLNRIIWEDNTGSYILDTVGSSQSQLITLPFSFDNSEITMSCLTANINGFSPNKGFGQFYALDNSDLYLVGMEFGDIKHSVLEVVHNVRSFNIFDKYGESCNPNNTNIQKTSGVVYKTDGTIDIYMLEGIKGTPVYQLNTIDGSVIVNDSNGTLNYNYDRTMNDSVFNKIENEGLLIGDVEIIIDVHFDTIFAFNKDLNKLILLDLGNSLLNNEDKISIEDPIIDSNSLLVINDVHMVAKNSHNDRSDANTLFLDLYGNVIALNRNTWYYENATNKETFNSIYPAHYKALNDVFESSNKIVFESTLETTYPSH